MLSRVLLITPVFYGVEKKIKSLLEESGFEVIWFENKILTFDYHGTKSKLKFLRKIYFFFFFPQIRYVKKELKKIGNTRFDILFSINGNIICPYLLKKLKIKNPSLFSVLYLWDSFSMYSWTNELKYFKKVYTFDFADSEKYGIEFKPNFYVSCIRNCGQVQEYDLIFAGKFNPYRLNVLDKIIGQVEKCSLKFYVNLWPAYKIFFHDRLVYIILKKFNFNLNWTRIYLLNYEAVEGILKRDYIIEKRLSYDDMQHYSMCSNVILDISNESQTGYTHRLIEALAYGKKVITTNSYLKKESFYNTEQIQIIELQNPNVDCKWIKEKATFPVDSYFSELELSKWLKSIIRDGIS